jgi:hypothetical protein
MALRLICILAIAALAACNDHVGNGGSLVGGPCISSNDCRFVCETGGDFPQGLCTLPCNIDDDCPDGTYCIDTEEGICMLGCDVPADCRGGYNCLGRKNRGTGGDSLVCSH